MSKTDLLAGPELNAQVATEVMEWYKVYPADSSWYWANRDGQEVADIYWSPSTDWSAAGEVLERMQAQDYDTRQAFIDYQGFVAHEYKYVGEYPGTRYTPLFLTPLAICLAALAAVRAKQKE